MAAPPPPDQAALEKARKEAERIAKARQGVQDDYATALHAALDPFYKKSGLLPPEAAAARDAWEAEFSRIKFGLVKKRDAAFVAVK